MRSYLSDLRHWLDQIDLARERDNDSEVAAGPLKGEAFEELNAPLMSRLTDLILALEEAHNEIDPADIDIHKEHAQRELLPLWMPSPFFYRVYTKPLGYAGDYQMVNMMWRNECDGLTTYAQVVDSWLLNGAPAQAHRNRIYMLEQLLQELSKTAAGLNRPVRILNIGCGPAHELQLFLSNYKDDHRFKIDLLDFNQETLDYTRGQLGAMNGKVSDHAEITYNLKSVQDLLRQAIERGEISERYDLIYCAGLFDYLSDRVCDKLVKLFYHFCEPGGRVLVTNVHSANPYKKVLENVMDWHLIHRNEEEMLRLIPQGSSGKVYGDRTGINVFLDISKPS
jgi:extracellular factor (EF) 3-hydroxypalmitic acid methyl ester biosynthesis protein